MKYITCLWVFLLKRINIKTVNIVFIFGSAIVLASHIIFSVGLYDGTHSLLQIIKDVQFYSLDQARKLVNILQALPIYLFIKFSSSSSLTPLIDLFLFGLIWIHIFSLLGCYFILPKNKKNLMFFPLFAFFAGPVISLHISISEALSVCSYFWLTVYVIYYTNLYNKIHKILFFIVPLPLILSHELMSYMALPLIALCWHKGKKERKLFNKSLIGFVMIFLLFTSAVQTLMILSHETLTNTKNDLSTIIDHITYFDFLFKPELNFLLAFTIFTLNLFFIQFYKNSIRHKIIKKAILFIPFGFILLLIVSIFQTANNFIPDYSIRFHPPIIILPFSMLIWWLYERRQTDIEKIGKVFLLGCILFCLTLVFCRINFDYKFHKYKNEISEQLAKCKGALQWETFKKFLKHAKFNHELMNFQGWQFFSISLLYTESQIIKSVILPTSSTCIGGCNLVLDSVQSKKCKENCRNLHKDKQHSLLLSKLKKLHENRFFDTSEVMNSISNNISKCNK